MKTVLSYLSRAAGFSEITAPPLQFEQPEICAMTGMYIQAGYKALDYITAAVGNAKELMPLSQSKFICCNAAKVLKGMYNQGSIIAFENGDYYHPLIAREKEESRGCWSDLARRLVNNKSYHGMGVVMILTTDTKKRIFHKARAGSFGASTPVLIYDTDSGLLQSLLINWYKMLNFLDIIEPAYTAGFSKKSIKTCLYHDMKTSEKIGMGNIVSLEEQIRNIRNAPEFLMAVLISQKQPDFVMPEPEPEPEPIKKEEKKIDNNPEQLKLF